MKKYKCRLTRPTDGGDLGTLPAGTEIEHKHAHFLVAHGVAEALDEETKEAARLIAPRAMAAREADAPVITKPAPPANPKQK